MFNIYKHYMDLNNLRKYRIDLEKYPFYNNKNIGIALFDLFTAFLGAYLLDIWFNVSKYVPICKKKKIVYYLLVIPFGIVIHHLIAHYISIKNGKSILLPDEITYLNRKLFSRNLNIYHLLIIILLYTIKNRC